MVLVNPARFLSWLRVVVRVVGRGKKTDETVNRMTGRKVVIRASHDTPRQIDGDPIGAGQRADLRVPARQAAGPGPPLTTAAAVTRGYGQLAKAVRPAKRPAASHSAAQRGVSSKTLICALGALLVQS